MTPADRVFATYAILAAREAARMEAYRDLEKAIAEHRAANPAPTGKYWDEERGKMVLCELPAGCTVTYVDGSPCGTRAVEWDDEGDAWCEMHGGER